VQLVLPGGTPPLQLTGSVDQPGNLIELASGESAITNSSLLEATNANLTIGANVLFVGGSLTSNTPDPLFTIDPTTVTVGGNLVLVQSGGSISLAGPLLSDTGSTFDIASRFLSVRNGSTLTCTAPGCSSPLITLSGSTVDTDDQFLRVDDGGKITLSGPLLDAANTTFNAGSSTRRRGFIQVRDSDSLLKSTGPGSLVTLNPSTVNVRRFLDVRESAKMETEGPVLIDTGSTFTTEGDFARVTQLGTFTGSGATALFQFSNSTLNVGTDVDSSDGSNPLDNFFRVDDSSGSTVTGPATVTLAGPLVSDSGSEFNIADDFLRVVDQSTLESTTIDAFIQFSDSTVNVNDRFVRVDDSGRLILGGNPDDPDQRGDLLQVSNGSTVTIKNGAFIEAFSGGLVLVPGAAVELDDINFDTVTINNSIVSTETINGIPVRKTNGAFISLGPNTGLGDVTVPAGFSVISADGAGTLVTIDPVLLPSSSPVLTIQKKFVPLFATNLANFSPGVSESVDTTGDRIVATALTNQGFAQLGTDPVISISNSNVILFSKAIVSLSGTSLAIPGPLLQITGGSKVKTLFPVDGTLLSVSSGSILKTFGTAPLIQIDSSTVDIGGNLTFEFDGTVSLGGPLLTATGSPMTSLSDYAEFNDTLTSTTTQALFQFTNSPVDLTPDGDFISITLGTTSQRYKQQPRYGRRNIY